MNGHLLDRPVWHALSARQAHFAEGDAHAKRFASDIGPLAGARDDSEESLRSLATLIPHGANIILLQVDNDPLPPGTVAEMLAEGVQMVANTLKPLKPAHPIEPLTDAAAPQMLALAAMTRPGPFATRTHRLGQFWGIKENGKLIAMAGERMKLEGFTEVSGVCTHPDHRGRGLAGTLSRIVATQIQERGETPFLHAYAANTAAINLYESLGFILRRTVTVTVLSRS